MCLIVHRDLGASGRGSNIPNEVIAYNSRLNPDGFGIAWREDSGELKSAKFGPHEYSQFHDLLKEIDRDNGVEYVAHFRKATHGPACTRLSHPFKYDDVKDGEVLIFHNGIITIDTVASESDTSTFVQKILMDLKPRWWGNSALRYLVEEAIGYSRILIMTAQETVRLNPKLWDYEGGIHYSTWPYARPAQVKGATYTYTPAGATVIAPALSVVQPVVDSSVKGSSAVQLWKGNEGEAWESDGHACSPLGDAKEDAEGDTYGTAICEECHTIGDYYVIEGKVYVDVKHFFVDDDPKEEETLARHMQQALAEGVELYDVTQVA